MLASGSSAWASKPAEMKISCGRQRSIAGSTSRSTTRRHASLPVPGGSGRLRMLPLMPRSVRWPGARIERRLVGRDVERVRVVVEDRLGAVAVMDVEIEDREPRQLVYGARLQGRHRDVVEHAKAHGLHGLGMVAGRPHGAERVPGLARHHRVDRGAGGAGRPQRRLARVRVQHRVGIDPHIALPAAPPPGSGWCSVRDEPAGSAPAWPPAPRGAPALRSPPRPRAFRIALQPQRRFGMARPGIVQQRHRMGKEQQRHRTPPDDRITVADGLSARQPQLTRLHPGGGLHSLAAPRRSLRSPLGSVPAPTFICEFVATGSAGAIGVWLRLLPRY